MLGGDKVILENEEDYSVYATFIVVKTFCVVVFWIAVLVGFMAVMAFPEFFFIKVPTEILGLILKILP